MEGARASSFNSIIERSRSSGGFCGSGLCRYFGRSASVRFGRSGVGGRSLGGVCYGSDRSVSRVPSGDVRLVVASPPCGIKGRCSGGLALGRCVRLLTSMFTRACEGLMANNQTYVGVTGVKEGPCVPLRTVIVKVVLSLKFLVENRVV